MKNELPFNWNILILYLLPLPWKILHFLFFNHLRNITADVFDSIVVSFDNLPWHNINFYLIHVIGHFSLLWNQLISWLILIVDNFLFYGDVLNATLSLDSGGLQSFLFVDVIGKSLLDGKWCSWVLRVVGFCLGRTGVSDRGLGMIAIGRMVGGGSEGRIFFRLENWIILHWLIIFIYFLF